MSLELHYDAGRNVLAVHASRKLTKHDYDEFVPAVERLIRQKGKIRLLFDMHEFGGWDPGALWEDARFGFKHASDIERLAMVGEKKWQELMSSLCHFLTKGEVRYFERSQIDEAWTWLGEG